MDVVAAARRDPARLRAARGGAHRRHAGDALPRAVRDHAGRARPAHRALRAGARAARGEPRRPFDHRRLLAARPGEVRRRAGPGRDVAGAGVGTGLDGGGARRPAARGDHPRRRAGHEPGAGGSRRGVLRAGAGQRAPARGPAGAAGGAAALAGADHGGGRRRAAADRAQPARRRAAAARRARAGSADAQGAAEGPGDRRAVGAAGERVGGAARARARHPSRDPHRPRARPGDQLARRPGDGAGGGAGGAAGGAAARAGGGRRVLPGRGGADERRALRGGRAGVGGGPAGARGARRAGRRRRRGRRGPVRRWRVCAAWTTASRPSVGRWRSTARSAKARGCRRGSRYEFATTRPAASRCGRSPGGDRPVRCWSAARVRGRLRRGDDRARAERHRLRHAELLPRPGRARTGRCGADRGRHARPRVLEVLGHHPQRRGLRRAPARRARRLPVARRVLARRHEPH